MFYSNLILESFTQNVFSNSYIEMHLNTYFRFYRSQCTTTLRFLPFDDPTILYIVLDEMYS